MSFIDELNILSRYSTIPEINACLKLAGNTLNDAPIDTDKIAKLRGVFLRTQEKLVKYDPDSWNVLKSAYQCLSFFVFSDFPPTNFDQLSKQQYHDIEIALFNFLFSLSKQYPINQEDPIDLEVLPDLNSRFMSLHGYHYKLETIVTWIRHSHQFTYPDTNKPMIEFDRVALINLCKERGLSLAPYPPRNTSFEAALENARLSMEDIQSLRVPYYHVNYVNVLTTLMNQYAYDIEAGINEINDLYPEQVDGLIQLFEYGIRGHHLRSIEIDGFDYTPHHTLALEELIQRHDYTIDAAVDFISNRNMDEVQEVYGWQPRHHHL